MRNHARNYHRQGENKMKCKKCNKHIKSDYVVIKGKKYHIPCQPKEGVK